MESRCFIIFFELTIIVVFNLDYVKTSAVSHKKCYEFVFANFFHREYTFSLIKKHSMNFTVLLIDIENLIINTESLRIF